MNVRAEVERLPHHPFTADEVSRMVEAGILGEDDRVELIEGELIQMASKNAPHEAIKSGLIRAFVKSAPDDLAVAVEATIQLSDRTIVEPDVALFPQFLFSRTGRAFLKPGPGELRLLVEIADSSLRYDKVLKAALYARHVVSEYWVINAESRVAWIHTGPQANGTWTSVAEKGPDEALTTEALPGLSVSLNQLD